MNKNEFNCTHFFFDFDGVIVASNDIKTEAFYDVFIPFGLEAAEAIKIFHMENQGISRFEKFGYIGREVLNRQFSKEELQDLSKNFSSLVVDKIIKAPLVLGVENFLLNNPSKKKFILSATPEDELRQICESKNISQYFIGVYGGPRSKVQIGRTILAEQNVRAQQVIFFGDAIADYNASRELKTNFMGILSGQNGNPFPANVKVMKDFITR